MKKLFMYVVVLSLFTSIACGKRESSSQKSSPKAAVQTQKTQTVAQKTAKQQAQKEEKPSFQYPLFDTYRIGEKFENRGYEGNELERVNPFFYGAHLDSQLPINVKIFITGNGIIAGINKSYHVDDGVKEFAKLFAAKLNVTLKGNFGSYVYEDKNTRIVIQMKRDFSHYVSAINDFVGIAEVDILDKKLTKEVNDDFDRYKAEEIKKEADNFKI